jgi:NAD/NADP transhydrogenase alpha subunit
MNGKIKQIFVLQETREGEGRVALTPSTISSLPPHRKYQIWVESGAGLKAGFTDSDYINAGAEIFSLSRGIPADTLILRVKRPTENRKQLENELFQPNTYMIGFLDPLAEGDHVKEWQACGINTFSVDCFKSLSVDDPKNMQAAMSWTAGRLAFQDGIHRYKGNQTKKLIVIGTGPASLSAVLEAKKQGVPAQVFGKQEHYRTKFEEAGVVYHVFPEMSNQALFLRPYLKEATIVITAPRTAGVRPPLLIDEESLTVLPKGAVVIDLTVDEGASVAKAKSDQVVVSNGVMIVHVSGYPKAEPHVASEAYAKCMVHLLADILSSEGEIRFDHALLQECWITHNGECNPNIRGEL